MNRILKTVTVLASVAVAMVMAFPVLAGGTYAGIAENAGISYDRLVLNGKIDSHDIENWTIQSKDIKKHTITSINIKNGTIGADQIGDGALTATTLADSAVTSAKILDGTIVLADIASDSVDSSKIVNADINSAAGIVDTKLATISTALKVSNSATTATNLNTASAIVARDGSGNFAAGTITANLTGNASTVTTNANMTGDVTSVGNATTIGANKVLTGMILDGTILTGDIAADTILAGNIATGAVATAEILNSTILNEDIDAAAGIVDTKLATISTALKVSNSATTATNLNTASAIVMRDGSGNFAAGTITANLTGNVTGNADTATNATNAATAADLVAAGSVVADSEVDNNLTISGGTVNNTVIGGSSAAAGTFTDLTASNAIAANGGITTNGGDDLGASGSRWSTIYADTLNYKTNLTDGGGAGVTTISLGTTTADLITIAGALQGANPLVFDGATAGTNMTTLAVTDPSGANTITLPNASGTVVLTGSTSTVDSTMITNGTIVDGDINAAAGIVDTKLATISTALKVSNSATTATNLNTVSAIVMRDGSGNFTAGTITAALSGNATSATSATTAGTVTTAAQPNITSVGSLTGLTSAGTVDFSGAVTKIAREESAGATTATPPGAACNATTLGSLILVDDNASAGVWLWACQESVNGTTYAWNKADGT